MDGTNSASEAKTSEAKTSEEMRSANHVKLLPIGLFTVLAIGATELSAQMARRSQSYREITPEIRFSVGRGFNFLLSEQQASSSFRDGSFPVAVNALVGMAFLAGGFTEEEGGKSGHLKAIRTCTTTIISYQKKNGYFDDGSHQGMYGHGFATLFLAEAYGHCGDRNKEVRDALRRAIRLIETSQGKEGGWDYLPILQRGSDTSITVCQTMALRAARNLGLKIDPAVIGRARSYIQKAQTSDGGFRYRTQNVLGMGGSAFPRSAAGVCILYNLGDYSSSEIKKGVSYLRKNFRYKNEYPFYANYYCAQAMFQAGGHSWREYFEWVSRRLLKDQRRDGSWRATLLQVEKFPAQTTAMALIVLQVPYRLLPILER